jgi:hypothetical protein
MCGIELKVLLIKEEFKERFGQKVKLRKISYKHKKQKK